MPDLIGAFRQRQPRDLAAAGRIEQAEFHALGMGGEDREIGAEAIPRRS